MPRISALLMLRSTISTVSAPATCLFRGSITNPTQLLCTLRGRRYRRLTQHLLPAGPLRPYPDRSCTGWTAPAFVGAFVAVGARVTPRPAGGGAASGHRTSVRTALRSGGVAALQSELAYGRRSLSLLLSSRPWQLISLERRRVPIEWSQCPRTIHLPLTASHVAGSPVLGVLSVSMTSTRSSGLPHLVGLSGPTNLRLNRLDLPCHMHPFDCMPAVRTPGASQNARP